MAKKTLKELQDLLALKSAEADAASKVGDAESRNLNTEEFDRFNTLLEEVRSLETEVNQLRSVEAFQAGRAASIGSGHTGGNRNDSPADRRDMGKFNLNRALLYSLDNRALDGIEAEVQQMGEARAKEDGISLQGGIIVLESVFEQRGQTVTGQTTNVGDQGGVLVEKRMQGLLGLMQADTFLEEVGAHFMTGLSADLVFPTIESGPTIQELTEIEAGTDSEVLFGSFEMKPDRRFTNVPISRQLMIQSSIDVQNEVIKLIAQALAMKMNAEAITNLLSIITSGNGNLLALGTNGLAPTYENIVALETLIDSVNHLKGGPKYLSNGKVRGKLKTTQRFAGTDGGVVWRDDNTMNGYSAVSSNIVPSNLTKGTSTGVCSPIILGDFEKFKVGIWGGTEYIIDKYSAKKKAQIEVTVNAFWNMKAARVKSFAGIKDALTP